MIYIYIYILRILIVADRSYHNQFPILPFSIISSDHGSNILPPPHFIPTHSLTTAEEDMETVIKHQIACHREDHDLMCVWDDELSHLLSQCLWGCEMGRLTRAVGGGESSSNNTNDMKMFEAWSGESIAGKEFKDGVKRAIPEGHTFKVFWNILYMY